MALISLMIEFVQVVFAGRIGDIDDIDETKKFHLYKLHGSIDWFTVSNPKLKIYNTIRFGDNMEFFGSQLDGIDYKWNELVPQILTGSLVKEHVYSFGIYFYMFNKFHNSLDKKNILIASGYGWNDAGINRRVLHWLQYYPNSKLILLQQHILFTPFTG